MPVQYIYKQIDTCKTIYYAWFEAMHTRIDLILCNQPQVDSLAVTEEIYNEIERIERLGNRFNPTSEISLINRLASGTAIEITAELFSILSECIEYNRKTDRVFDVTIHSKIIIGMELMTSYLVLRIKLYSFPIRMYRSIYPVI